MLFETLLIVYFVFAWLTFLDNTDPENIEVERIPQELLAKLEILSAYEKAGCRLQLDIITNGDIKKIADVTIVNTYQNDNGEDVHQISGSATEIMKLVLCPQVTDIHE
jgi:hypothetical protein